MSDYGEVGYSHLFPGVVIDIRSGASETPPASFDLRFADGSESVADVVSAEDALSVAPYETAAGTHMAETLWAIQSYEATGDGAFALRLGPKIASRAE